MLTDLRSILALAEEKGCAIPAFNCYTQECVMGVLEAAKETGAPVIFQMFSRLADTNDGPPFWRPSASSRSLRSCTLTTARASRRLSGPSVWA